MAQYLVVHSWPDGSHSIMPEVFTGQVPADIVRDHCNAMEHDRPGHNYVTATVSALLHVSPVPPPKACDDKQRALTDDEVWALARA